MKNKLLIIAFALFFVCAGSTSVAAQTAASFKISAIKIVPYNQLTGEFEPEITPNDERAFFNEVSLGLFITAVISGKTDTYSTTRKVEITVLEGTKVRSKKIADASMVGADGKYYVPVFVESAFCQEVTVTAKLIGQKTASTMTRKVPFACGE